MSLTEGDMTEDIGASIDLDKAMGVQRNGGGGLDNQAQRQRTDGLGCTPIVPTTSTLASHLSPNPLTTTGTNHLNVWSPGQRLARGEAGWMYSAGRGN